MTKKGLLSFFYILAPRPLQFNMKAPIFILGYPRSGTSIIFKAIKISLNLSGYGESHVMPLLQEIIYKIEQKRDLQQSTLRAGHETTLHKINLNELSELNIRHIRESYLDIFNRSPRFVDKTPGADAAHGWKLIKRTFPEAAILCCYRSPAEVIESSLKKFSHGVEEAENNEAVIKAIASGWASAMEGIDQLMQSPFAKDAILIDQLKLRTDPATEITKLFDFLGASQELAKEAIKICVESRDDVLTSAIGLSFYKKLSSLGLETAIEAEVRDTCSKACTTFSIEL